MVIISITPGKFSMEKFRVRLKLMAQRMLRDLAVASAREWRAAAGRQLTTTRRNYQSAIKVHKRSADHIDIVLHHPDKKINWLITAIEVGVKSYDLKKGLLASPSAAKWSRFAKKKGPGKAKINAPFLDVPFKDKGAKTRAKPSYFRRVSPASKGWKHPGFRPEGKGGLKEPLRKEVKEYIKKQAPILFKAALSRMKI